MWVPKKNLKDTKPIYDSIPIDYKLNLETGYKRDYHAPYVSRTWCVCILFQGNDGYGVVIGDYVFEISRVGIATINIFLLPISYID